jgi:hypothetical protein
MTETSRPPPLVQETSTARVVLEKNVDRNCSKSYARNSFLAAAVVSDSD